jgi:hypothetical protein
MIQILGLAAGLLFIATKLEKQLHHNIKTARAHDQDKKLRNFVEYRDDYDPDIVRIVNFTEEELRLGRAGAFELDFLLWDHPARGIVDHESLSPIFSKTGRHGGYDMWLGIPLEPIFNV